MFDWLRRAAVGVISGLRGGGRRMLSSVYSSRMGDPPIRGTAEFLELYAANGPLHAVARRVSNSVGETVWTAEYRGAVQDENLLLRTLRKPNTVLSGHQLFKVTQLCLDLVGDAFWLKVRNGLGVPVELWPIPPHWITALPTPERPRFAVSRGSWQESVPDTEVHWFHDATPADPYGRGRGLAQAGSDEIETHEYASKHAKQLFFNRAIPDFVVMDEGASEEEIKTHERSFEQRLRGFWRWFRPYFTNRKLEFWQPQQMNLENLTMVPLLKHERDAILVVWGLPPEQLGIIENSNRATIDASDYVYESRVIRPRRVLLRDSIQNMLVPEYDARLVFGFVDTVPADKEHQLNVAKAAPHVLRLDEWRALMGREPEGGELGRARLLPLNSYLAVDPLDSASRPSSGGRPENTTEEGASPPDRT